MMMQNGRVMFEGFRLSGGVAESGECKPDGSGEYRGDRGVCKLSNGKLTFTKDGTNETLTIQNFRNGYLGITLTSKDPEPSFLGTPSPNFSSPLVLDLNGDGVTSTFIYDTQIYFDLNNDGMRERTAWVQSIDALLVLDKNRDGIINDGTELFGNNTLFRTQQKAA